MILSEGLALLPFFLCLVFGAAFPEATAPPRLVKKDAMISVYIQDGPIGYLSANVSSMSESSKTGSPYTTTSCPSGPYADFTLISTISGGTATQYMYGCMQFSTSATFFTGCGPSGTAYGFVHSEAADGGQVNSAVTVTEGCSFCYQDAIVYRYSTSYVYTTGSYSASHSTWSTTSSARWPMYTCESTSRAQKVIFCNFQSALVAETPYPVPLGSAQPVLTSGAPAPVPNSATSATPSATQASGDKSDNQSNVGAIAGGVVGGAVGLALVGVLAFFLWKRQRRSHPVYVKPPMYSTLVMPGSPTPQTPISFETPSKMPQPIALARD